MSSPHPAEFITDREIQTRLSIASELIRASDGLEVLDYKELCQAIVEISETVLTGKAPRPEDEEAE